jgi:hypothetical protein
MKKTILLIAAALSLLLTGCFSNKDLMEEREEGFREGYNEGYATGFEDGEESGYRHAVEDIEYEYGIDIDWP